MSKDDVIEVEGVVTVTLPNAMFHVELENGHNILAQVSSKIRMQFIRCLPRDKVSVELSTYDLIKVRINYSYNYSKCQYLMRIINEIIHERYINKNKYIQIRVKVSKDTMSIN